MIDHFYDKLLRLGNFPIDNEYFKSECLCRMKPVIEFCLEFSKKYPEGSILITDTKIKDFEEFIHHFIVSHV
jgi:hypothetical protein